MSIKSQESQRSKSRNSRNAANYLASKSKQDHVLLRLEKGDRERMDAACTAAGVSRASFARLYLMPVVDALSRRTLDIERARLDQKISLMTFVERAIDLALRPEPKAAAPSEEVLSEFDALFGPADGGS